MIWEAIMKRPVMSMLVWTPRVLGILFVLFISLFSLDVLEMEGGFWELMAGFVIHNLPAIVLIIALILAWRREWIGAVGYFAVGLWFLVLTGSRDRLFVGVFVVIPTLIATFFLLGWIYRRQIEAK